MFMIDRLYDIEGNNLSNERAENILINVLEIIPKRESDILCKIINKKMKVSGLTERLVRETYPDLLPEELVS